MIFMVLGNMKRVFFFFSSFFLHVVRHSAGSESDRHFFEAAECDSRDLAFRGVVVLSCQVSVPLRDS